SGGSACPVTWYAADVSSGSSCGTGGAVDPSATATPETAPMIASSTATRRQNSQRVPSAAVPFVPVDDDPPPAEPAAGVRPPAGRPTAVGPARRRTTSSRCAKPTAP